VGYLIDWHHWTPRSIRTSLDSRPITSPSEGGDGELTYGLYSRKDTSKGFHENGSDVSESESDGQDGFTGTYNQETINR
jgi:hypothetical protein